MTKKFFYKFCEKCKKIVPHKTVRLYPLQTVEDNYSKSTNEFHMCKGCGALCLVANHIKLEVEII